MCTVLGVWPTCVQYWGYGQHVYSTGGMANMCTVLGVWPTCVQYWGYGQHVYSTGGMANMCTVLGVWPTCVQYWGYSQHVYSTGGMANMSTIGGGGGGGTRQPREHSFRLIHNVHPTETCMSGVLREGDREVRKKRGEGGRNSTCLHRVADEPRPRLVSKFVHLSNS